MAAARPDRDALHPLEGKTSSPISSGKEHNSRPHSSRFCLLPAWCSGLLLPRVSQLLAVSDECTLLLPHAHSRTNYLQSPEPHCALLSPPSAPTTWPKMAAATPSTSPRGGKNKNLEAGHVVALQPSDWLTICSSASRGGGVTWELGGCGQVESLCWDVIVEKRLQNV